MACDLGTARHPCPAWLGVTLGGRGDSLGLLQRQGSKLPSLIFLLPAGPSPWPYHPALAAVGAAVILFPRLALRSLQPCRAAGLGKGAPALRSGNGTSRGATRNGIGEVFPELLPGPGLGVGRREDHSDVLCLPGAFSRALRTCNIWQGGGGKCQGVQADLALPPPNPHPRQRAGPLPDFRVFPHPLSSGSGDHAAELGSHCFVLTGARHWPLPPQAQNALRLPSGVAWGSPLRP